MLFGERERRQLVSFIAIAILRGLGSGLGWGLECRAWGMENWVNGVGRD